MASPTDLAESRAPSYVVDAGKSRFIAWASASGLLSAFGHNPAIAIRSFRGEAWFRPQDPEQSSVRIEIDAASLAVTNETSEKDRQEMERTMKEEVLETARYPEIRFQSSGMEADKTAEDTYRMKILGKLTLHGEERDLEIPANVTVSEDTLRAYGDFSIRQTNYRIRLVSAAGGALKLKDELKFSFHIVAHRRSKEDC